MTSGEFVIDSSDQVPQPQFVLDIDPSRIDDPRSRKAVLAMQAMRLFVDSNEQFGAANERLIEAAAAIDRPPTITYEDMIFVNPVYEGSYVMLQEPGIANVEMKFYTAHRRIEQETYSAIAGLVGKDTYNQSTSDPDNPHGVKIDFDALRSPVDHLQQVNRLITDLNRGMTHAEFTQLRTVFGGLNGHDGPSGLHSSSIPLLDFLIHGGGNINEGDRQRMTQASHANLHPVGQPFDLLLQAALEGAPVQLDLDPGLQAALVDEMNTFRRRHRGSVKKHLPDVDAGKDAGTGGIQTVGAYLAGKVVGYPDSSQIT